MTELSSWAAVICIAAVICEVLELLAPSSRMDGVLRFVFGGFMLCAIVLPLTELDIDLGTIPETDSMSLSAASEIDEMSEEYLKSGISDLVKTELKELNAEAEEISVEMDIDEDNCINMIRIKLKMSKDYSELYEKIKTKISEDLGLECEINGSF